MKTLVATVSIGSRKHLTRHSVPRMEHWSERHGLDFIVIRQPIVPENLPPHFNKLGVPLLLPGYDKYVIVDDDLLISTEAPAPPNVESGFIGLVPDDEQRHTKADYVKWTGNTGFIVADSKATPIFADALEKGSDETIWGYADQSALNRSAWRAKKIQQLDWRWNFMPVINHIVTHDSWPQWRDTRSYRIRYYLSLLLRPCSKQKKKLRDSFGVHLVRAPYPALFSSLIK